MTDSSSEAITKALDTLLNPKPNSGVHFFTYTTAIIVSLITLFIVCASSPFLSHWYGCNIIHYIGINDIEAAKHWCDWSATFLQILLVAAIGGVVFTDAPSKYCRNISDRISLYMLDRASRDADRRSQLINEFILDAKTLLESKDKITNLSKLRRIVALEYKLFSNTTNLPTRYFWFALRGLLLNFPGQIYGFAAFIILFLQITAITTKITLDYTLHSSCS